MNILIKFKGIFIVAIICIGAFAGYYYFLGEGSQSAGSSYLTSTASTGGVSEADILGAEIGKAIREVDALKLDKSIFNHPILNRLEDRDKAITPQDEGRKNPFAPLNGQADEDDDVDLSGLIDSLSN